MRQCRPSGRRTLRLIWPASMSGGVSSVTAWAGTWLAPARRSGGGAIRRVKSGLRSETNTQSDTVHRQTDRDTTAAPLKGGRYTVRQSVLSVQDRHNGHQTAEVLAHTYGEGRRETQCSRPGRAGHTKSDAKKLPGALLSTRQTCAWYIFRDLQQPTGYGCSNLHNRHTCKREARSGPLHVGDDKTIGTI